MDIYLSKYIFPFHIFSSFLGFKHGIIRYVDFTRIAVSNRVSDDVIN